MTAKHGPGNLIEKRTSFFIVILSLIGFFVFLFKTKYGIGVNPDSVLYLDTARNLSHGLGIVYLSKQGMLLPATHFLPLYPILLSSFNFWGIAPLESARWLNAFLFSANISLVGYLIYKYTHSIGISILGSLLMLTSVDNFMIHLRAMTDPLFIFLTFLGLLLLAAYLTKPKPLYLFASAGIIALSSVTRFAGIPVIATGIIGLILLSSREVPTHTKILDGAFFGIISFIPLTLWMLRNFFLTNHVVGKEMIFHPIAKTELIKALSTMSQWFLLERSPGIISLIPLGVLFVAIFIYRKRLFRRVPVEGFYMQLPGLIGIFIIVYTLSLIITISFFDASVSFYYRFLYPVYALGLIFVLCLTHDILYPLKEKPVIKVMSVITGIILGSVYSLHGAMWVRSAASDQSLGYVAKEWRESEIIERIKALPPQILIYSNGSDFIYFRTGRKALTFPYKMNTHSLAIETDYLSKFYIMQNDLKNKKGVLIYFNAILRSYLPSIKELKQKLPLQIIGKCKDGAIYIVHPVN